MRCRSDEPIGRPILDHISTHVGESIVRVPDGTGSIEKIGFPHTGLRGDKRSGV